MIRKLKQTIYTHGYPACGETFTIQYFMIGCRIYQNDKTILNVPPSIFAKLPGLDLTFTQKLLNFFNHMQIYNVPTDNNYR